MPDADDSTPLPAGTAPDAPGGPLPDAAAPGLTFSDLLSVDEIQAIQDAFSAATGVASLITDPDGTPITRPSNFCRLCNDVIRGTDTGRAKCAQSDAVIGRPDASGPVIQPCLSGGLWDAGASIHAGGVHVANWLIGQVRNEAQDEAAMLAYADEIGAEREEFAAALAEVPAMPLEKFELIAKALYVMANELSLVAYQNLEQKRLTAESERAAESIRESRELTTAILDAVPQSVFVKDAQGRYLSCNQPFAESAGLERPEQIVGMDDYALPWKQDADAYLADDSEVMDSNRPKRHIIEQLRTADGSVLWVDTTKLPLLDADGMPYAVLGVFDDITERKHAEEALIESRARLDLALRSASMGVWTFDLVANTRVFDDQVCHLLGLDPTTFKGTAEEFFAAVHPDDVEMLKAALARTIEQSAPYEPEYRTAHRDGTECWVAARGRLVRDAEGRATRINGVLWDITDRKRTEQQLARQSERIERTLTSVIDIARDIVEERDPYTAGHQLRVSQLATRIAQDLGMCETDIEDVRVAALLHDVGKVVVPTEILSKPGPVADVERRLLQSHAEAGHRILAGAHMDEPVPELVHQHHERCDGTGYPRGLVAEQILPGAKVLAVADVVEAMVSHRPYRPGLGLDAALEEIERGAGTHFDPDVARCCIALFREHEFDFA